MSTTTARVGSPDAASGVGVHEYLGLVGPWAGQLQAAAAFPHGEPWQIKASASHTPTLITDTLPPSPVMAWKVPAGKALLFLGGQFHGLTAATEYVRVCRRHFLLGYTAAIGGSAAGAPAVALQALTDGIGTSGAYTYKVAEVDWLERENRLSSASLGVTLTATNQGVTLTLPVGVGGVKRFNIYRTLADGSTYYFVGAAAGNSTTYVDALPDAAVDISLTPTSTHAGGIVAGETLDGPMEVVVENLVLTGASSTHLVYADAFGLKKAQPVAFPAGAGSRIRAKLFGETANFVATPTAAANLWRGALSSDPRTRRGEDFAATAATGINATPSAGAFIVWGQQVIGASERDEATAAIRSRTIQPLNPHGVLLPPLSEIVVEIGAIAAGVASVRDLSIYGLLIPTA